MTEEVHRRTVVRTKPETKSWRGSPGSGPTELPLHRGSFRAHNRSTMATSAYIHQNLSTSIPFYQYLLTAINLYADAVGGGQEAARAAGERKSWRSLAALGQPDCSGEQRNLALPKAIVVLHVLAAAINIYQSLPTSIIFYRRQSCCTGLHHRRAPQWVLTSLLHSVTMFSEPIPRRGSI